jgi:hypothetical protein
VNNFAEIFVSIGQILLVVAITFSSGLVSPDLAKACALGGIVLGIVMAEFFNFRARMLLPSIIACVSAAYFAAVLTTMILGFGRGGVWSAALDFRVALVAFATLAILLWRHWLPFLAMPVAGLGLLFAFSIFGLSHVVLGVTGLLFLAFAVCLDLGDPARTARRSDFAFWFYVAGAPMLLHPVYSSLVRADDPAMASIAVLSTAAIAGLFGLVLDRRSPIVASLGYLGVVVGWGAGRIAATPGGRITLTLFLLGVGVILLGVLWGPVRRLVLRPLVNSPWIAKLPPVREGT